MYVYIYIYIYIYMHIYVCCNIVATHTHTHRQTHTFIEGTFISDVVVQCLSLLPELKFCVLSMDSNL